MRKKLLTLGALALAMSMDAQFLSYVGDKGQVFVKEGALVFNGGGIRTVGTGVVDNSGNIMVVGSSSDKFATVTTAGANKADGGNFILRMTDPTVGKLRYGQLYINGLTQANITGIVDKEYKDTKHGEYQQIALPFYGKVLSELNSEFGKTFSNTRWSKNEILVWDNTNVLFDVKSVSSKTTNGTAYYAIGSTGFDASSVVRTVKGVPFADGITETMAGAGASVDFGTDGNGRNKYREAYNTYLQDDFETVAWGDEYGKNLYQFGNPFLTNIDLLRFVKESGDVIGVRYESENVKTTTGSDYMEGFVTESTSYKALEVAMDGLVGDLEGAIIRPMQTFVVKTAGDTSLNFDEIRRFAYIGQEEPATTVTTGLKTASLNRVSNNTLRTSSLRSASLRSVAPTVKQLGVIALDAKGNELGRTYYYVSPNAITGAEQSENKRQVKASGTNIIGTFEENKNGGYDEAAANNYWLYINEANENDFKGKELPLALYSDAIKSLKFEIREKEELIEDNATLSNGESFYIKAENGELKEVRQGMVIASTANSYGLFYGAPEVKAEKVEETIAVVKRTETDVVYDVNAGEYKVLFADDWNTATVQVFNSRGRLASTAKNVNAKSDFTVKLPSAIGTYVVRVISETGVKVDKKVLKN